MEISSDQLTTLEQLPDEILLEIFKYLLCGDILRSFFGLNCRINRMITQYCHHVSLHRISITHYSDLCINVLPQIGFRIQSLVINHSFALQNRLFIKYFGNIMAIIFPSLEKIRLLSVLYIHLITFLNILHDLKKLVQINICDLFNMDKKHQTIAFHTLLQANNNQLTSILLDDNSGCLSFNNTDSYVNIVQLRINMNSIKELASLFAAVPNVCCLHLTFKENDEESIFFDEMNISSLLHLTDFRLCATKRWWKLNELLIIFDYMPNLQRLSLFLSTKDLNLVYGNILLPLLSPAIQEFNYAIYYCPELQFDQNDAIVASWPPSLRITCYVSDTIWFIHTLHWYSPCIEIIPPIGNIFSSQRNHDTCYDKQVKRLEVVCDQNFTLSNSLAAIAQCHRMRELTIWLKADDGTVKEVKNSLLSLPKLSQLTQFQLFSYIPVDLHHLSLILVAAPELIRVDLPFDCLIDLLQIEHVNHLLQQRIKTLIILNTTDSSSQVTINEEHVHLIVSNFHALRELYIDLSHLKPSTTIESNEIKSSSIESMILRLLSQFKQHKLNVLTVDIQPNEMIKQDPKEWLQQNTILGQQLFDAEFDEVLNRLMIWM